MKKFLLILTMLTYTLINVYAQDFKVLYVNDDNNGSDEDGPIVTALDNSGITYQRINGYDSVPSYGFAEKFDMILWYTGNDATTHLWDADSTYKDVLEQFEQNGGIVWVDGLDFIYDIYGTAPDTFPAGNFMYDKLGISKYISQSYADDGNQGVPQYDIYPGNTITHLDPVTWVYSTLYYAEGLSITSSANALYKMYDDASYPLAGQITALYNQVGTGTYITSGFRLAKINSQSNINLLISDILNYSKDNWDHEANSISPVTVQNIGVNSDGSTLTATETVGWDSREWKYSTTSGGPYQSFSTPETGKAYTPNFSTAGTYYVVCETTYGSTVKTSNEVQINVSGNSVSISPAETQYNFTGQNGTSLTANETPASATSREWKYSITSGGPYQSFSTPETGTTFTPNFTNRGIYYVVCESDFGGTVVTSNEVKIIVDTTSSDYYITFDGDDSFYIKDDNKNYINVSDKWTFETWVKVDTYQSGTYPVIMDRDKCFSMYVQADSTDDFSIAFVKRDASDNIAASLSSANSTAVDFKFHQWYHVAAVYDGTTAKLFINGQEVDNSTDDFSLLAASTSYVNIGCRYRNGYERYFTGAMENIRISDSAMYSSNFTPDFYAPLQADSNSVFCLNLEDNPNSALFDFSGHFSNITLRNSPNNPDWTYKFDNSVNPPDAQNIVTNTDGTQLTVTENGLASSREWKYSTTSGGPYQSFSPAQTDTVYTPNFSTVGTYYVVCQSDFNGTTVTSNEVQINVSEAASITTGTITGSPFYVSADSSANVNVPFTITGTFNSDNIFSAYLSDSTGDFTNESLIGFLSSQTAGTINAQIPAGTPSGSHYRIRVEASSPAVVGTDNGDDLQIVYLYNSIAPTDEQFIDVNQDGTPLNVTEAITADSREWKYSTVSGGPYQSFSTPETGTTYTPNFANAGTYYIVCQSVFNGGNIITTSNEVKINVLTNYKILFVNDDNNGDESAPIDTALAHTGYSYVKINTTDTVPDYAYMQNFDLVLWYTGNDGTTNLWDTSDSTFIDDIEQYVENGGTFWLDGIDWIYDLYGTAPDSFPANSFMYDKLGIAKYLDQSHSDDGSTGVTQMDITPENKITTENPVTWLYSSLWFADGLQITDKAVPLYVFGGTNYVFAGQVSSLYKQVNTGTYLTTGLRIAKLGDGSNPVQDSVDKIVNEVVAYTQQTPALYCGNIDQTAYYVTATSGSQVVIPFTIDGGFDFDENNTFTAYLSDANGDFTNETAIGTLDFFASDTIFAEIPAGTPAGTGYRIRIKSSNPALVSNDNGVDLSIYQIEQNVTPTDTQRIDVGQQGTQLTVNETPAADSREWLFSTVSGGPYQSFHPAETGTTYTPLFDSAATYYVVCRSVFGSSEITSNEVVIIVSDTLSITTGEIAGSPFTVTATEGADVQVPFTVTGEFNTDNTFSAYLSDSMGNFTNKILIGSIDGTTGDTIDATIPAGTQSGSHYRIRVESSSPEYVGTDNGVDLVVILDTTPENIVNTDNNFKIYPNPVQNILFVNVDKNQNLTLKITDNLGRVLVEKQATGGYIDVSNLPAGVYNLTISNNEIYQTLKFIKQ